MHQFYTIKAIFLLTVLFLMGQATTVEASHIPGANITYSCNPSNPLQYTFRLTLFRRCPGTHPNTMSGTLFTLTNTCGLTSPTVPTFTQVGTAQDVNQLCNPSLSSCNGGSEPSVWLYTYEATITLPAHCDSWNMAYQLCCRDASSNLQGGSGNTMYTSTRLNTLTAPCNSSPVITSPPIPYACTNTPFSYCLTVSDAEGDSVAFRMVSPGNSGGTPIGHLAGFSINAPLQNFTLDPATGCFSLNQPTTGNYVVAIAIDEFDAAGNLISTIVHDFQILVINCTNTPPNNPSGSIMNVTGNVSQTGPNAIAVCRGQSFCFDVVFADTVDVNDTIIVTTDGTTLFPGATFTQTGINPVRGTFCWTATTGNTGAVATFNAADNGCPVRGVASFGVFIDIVPGVYAGPDASVCGGTPVQLNATGGTVFNWSPATGLSCTNCPNPIANPATTTAYIVTGNLPGTCNNRDTVIVNVENIPPTATITGNVGICGTSGSNTLTATGGSRFLWSTGATTPSITVSPSVTTDYSVTVTNFVGGCEAYDTATVTVSPGIGDPNVQDITICNGSSGNLTARGGGTYLWSDGSTTASISVSPTVPTDYYVTVTLGTCTEVDTGRVFVTPTSAPVLNCPPDTTLPFCDNVYTFNMPIALDYCAASPCVSSPINDVLTGLNTNGTTIAGNISNPYAMLDGITGTCISDGGNDMYDCGNQLNTNLGTLIPYTGGGITASHPAFGGGSYFTHKFNNLWVMTADLINVSSFYTTGNNGADGSGNIAAFDYTVSVGCLTYHVYVKRIFGAGDPSINHIYIVPDNGTTPRPTHTWALNTNDDLHTLDGLMGFDRLYYLLLAGNAGYSYTNTEIQNVVLDFLTNANVTTGGVAQAPVTQIAGPPSGSTFPSGRTTLTFQAIGAGGTATCSYDVIVSSGAPVITCRPDTTIGACNANFVFPTPTATDPCSNSCVDAPIDTVLSRFNARGTAIAGNIPSPYNFLDGLTGTSISDGGNDMYDGGNILNTNLASSIPYTNGAVQTHAGFSGGSYFTQKFNNLWLMSADITNINTFTISGNNGADGRGTASGFDYTVTVGCMTYYVFVKQVYGAGDPSINHVFIVPDNGTTPAPTHTFSTNTDDDNHVLNGLGGFERLYYLLFAGSGGYNYSNAEIRAVVLDFLNQANPVDGVNAPVTIAQIAGPTSGSAFPVGTTTVTFRATSGVTGLTTDCSFDVNVTPNPTAAIAGNLTLCAGGSTTLTASGGGTYLWNTGATTAAITVSPTVPTSYAVSVTSPEGCEDSTLVTTNVSVASTAPTIAPVTGSICPNSTTTLVAAGGVAGAGSAIQWYTGPNGTGTWMGSGASVAVSPTTTTTYYARREGGCNTTVDDQVTVILKNYIYALNAATTNTYCTDNMGWHHFYNGNEIILSIRGDLTGAPAGFPQITINDNGTYFQQTQGPFTPADCANGLTPGEERFEMERSWDVNFGGGTLNPPYEVRFYYQPAERAAVENAAIAHMAAYPACGYGYKYPLPLGSFFFKNTGSQYVAPIYEDLQLANTAGVTPNGVNYAELTGVTSFSGGSLGVILVPNTLLSAEWLYFEGETRDNSVNHLRWATQQEQNNDYFNVQRSADGVNFETIGRVQAQGTTSNTTHYTFDDTHPLEGDNYYRLELVETTGATSLSKTILLYLEGDGSTYSFFPNPTTGTVYYRYQAPAAEQLSIEVLDVLGKEVRMQTVNSAAGLNNIPVDLTDLPAGTYMVRVHNEARASVHTAKIIRER